MPLSKISFCNARNLSALILCVYTLWRFGIAFYPELSKIKSDPASYDIGDGYDYRTLGESLAQELEYKRSVDSKPYSVRLPGYPIFVAFIMKISGKHWLKALFVSHILFNLAAVLGIFFIVDRLRGWKAALLAGFIAASYAPYHCVCFLIYREAMTLALFVLFLALLLSSNYDSKRTYIVVGSLLALTCMVREEFILLLCPLTLLIWKKEASFSFKYEKLKPVLLKCAIIAGIFAIVFMPWIIRNYLVFGRLQILGTNGGMLFHKGNNMELCESGEIDYAFYYEAPELKTMSHHEVSSLYAKRAFEFILKNPWMELKNLARKVCILYSESIDNFDDLPFILFGLFIGALIVSFLKLEGIAALTAMFISVISAYIYGRNGFNISLLAPNIEFGLLKYIGFAGMAYAAYKKIERHYIIVYFMLFMVNVIFIPQHRQRWIMDCLFMIWASIFLFDLLKYLAHTDWRERLFSRKTT